MSLTLHLIALAAAQTAAADIEIKDVHIAHARAADTLGYSAVIVNNGPSEATNVRFEVLLPMGAAARNGEPCIMPDMRDTLGVVQCYFDKLAPGEEKRVFFLTLRAKAKAQFIASAGSDLPDPKSENNISMVTGP